MQWFEQRAVTRFGIKIGRASIQIIGSHGMTNRLTLLDEGDAILIVVATFGHQIAHIKKGLGELEIFGFARGAIEFNRPHVV